MIQLSKFHGFQTKTSDRFESRRTANGGQPMADDVSLPHLQVSSMVLGTACPPTAGSEPSMGIDLALLDASMQGIVKYWQ